MCYPWLRPYTTHKVESKSTPYIFLGYSLNQSAYKCYDSHTQKIYISRHVIFVEDTFLFIHKETTLLHPNSDIPLTWFPYQSQLPTSSTNRSKNSPTNNPTTTDAPNLNQIAQTRPPLPKNHEQTLVSPPPTMPHEVSSMQGVSLVILSSNTLVFSTHSITHTSSSTDQHSQNQSLSMNTNNNLPSQTFANPNNKPSHTMKTRAKNNI